MYADFEYYKNTYKGNLEELDAEKALKQAEEELEIEDLKSFEEKMYGDVWNKEKYLCFTFT